MHFVGRIISTLSMDVLVVKIAAKSRCVGGMDAGARPLPFERFAGEHESVTAEVAAHRGGPRARLHPQRTLLCLRRACKDGEKCLAMPHKRALCLPRSVHHPAHPRRLPQSQDPSSLLRPKLDWDGCIGFLARPESAPQRQRGGLPFIVSSSPSS